MLLRNVKETLPLDEPKEGTSIVVIGPQANATGQLGGNYFNNECASGTVILELLGGRLRPALVVAVRPNVVPSRQNRCGKRSDGDVLERLPAALLRYRERR